MSGSSTVSRAVATSSGSEPSRDVNTVEGDFFCFSGGGKGVFGDFVRFVGVFVFCLVFFAFCLVAMFVFLGFAWWFLWFVWCFVACLVVFDGVW